VTLGLLFCNITTKFDLEAHHGEGQLEPDLEHQDEKEEQEKEREEQEHEEEIGDIRRV
jgi:hypothetical protein